MSINFYDQQDSSPHIYTNNDDSISPDRLHGLVLWIDGQCNTRKGADSSKTYMQDLVLPQADDGGFVSGYTEFLTTSGNNWDNYFLTLGNYAHYPGTGQSKVLTVECVLKVTKELEGSRFVLSANGGAGWCVHITAERKPSFQVFETESNAYVISGTTNSLEVGKAYYMVGTMSDNGNVTFEVKGFEEKISNPLKTYKMRFATTALGTQSNTTSDARGELWDGLAVAMGRVWYRVLTDEEIEANYQDCKKRFNL